MNGKIIICLLTGALLYAPPFVEAQQRGKIPRVGVLEPGLSPAKEAFDKAFATIVQGRADALMIPEGAMLSRNRQRIFGLAISKRLPTISGGQHFAEAGSLMSYGASVRDICRRSAVFVDKILKGSKPSDLPVERPAKFEFVVNLKTAKQIGLKIPPNVLARADRVIK